MSNIFSLLSLSKEMDRHPRTWICVQGNKIRGIVNKIEKELIKEKQVTREEISRILSKRLKCNHVSIKNIIRGKNMFYPIPFLLELCKFSDKKENYKRLIEKNIRYLKVNSASAKQIKASKDLSATLAKIIGAFCADGSLSAQFTISSRDESNLKKVNLIDTSKIRYSKSRKEYYLTVTMNKDNYENFAQFSKENDNFQIQTHYAIELTDEHQSNVEAFVRWIYEEFCIVPTGQYRRENAYRVIFSNKILARYLIEFFGMLPGYKCSTVNEPILIKNAHIDIRKEFAKGVIMFDGSVSKRKNVTFSTISQHLAESIMDIFIKDGIECGIYKNKRNEYNVYTTSKNKINKLLTYFEKGTKKWELLRWLSDKSFDSKQVSYKKDLKNTMNILDIIKQVNLCDAECLMTQTSYSHTTVRGHLLILKERGLIRLSNHPVSLNGFVSDNTSVFLKDEFHKLVFTRILEKFKSYDQFATFIEVSKTALSAWKVKKNRIPLKILKNICLSIEMSYLDVLKNVFETDREIAEII